MHLQHLNTTTNTTSLFLSLLLDDLFSFCTFLASHPLPFAYLLFFSPRILSLLSFLSPLLLLSTTLLLLTLTTPPPPHAQHGDTTLHPPKFLGKTCAIALRLLKKIEVALDDIEDPIGLLEHLDWIVLSPCRDAPSPCFDNESSSSCKAEEEEEGTTTHSLEESKDANLSSCNERISENASRATTLESCDDLLRSCSIRRRALHTRAASEGVRRDGSMRKEREWKRTLACKLYEERITFKLHDERAVDVIKGGEEEMDLLWEAYEANASKINNIGREKAKKGVKDERKKELKVKAKAEAEAEPNAEAEEDDDKEEEEEDGSVRQLCCLKALKLSAGNMNLGVGRPNLMKISKVLKGMRMFQHFGKHSNSRKK